MDDLFGGRRSIDLPYSLFPKTRYQGSKRRLVEALASVFDDFEPARALDLYSGTATVSLLLRAMGWSVVANDFLAFNNTTARVMLGRRNTSFSAKAASERLKYLLLEAPIHSKPLIAENFRSIYFPDEENLQIDRFCQNLHEISFQERDLYIYAVGQALLMKRPYNLFHRANLDMRTREVVRSFGNVKTWNTSIHDHAIKIITAVQKFPFLDDHEEHQVTAYNTGDLSDLPTDVDLVYLDPPYLNASGLGVDYCHFYHFLDGLCDYSLFGKFDPKFSHRPILLKSSAWLDEATALEELDRIVRKWQNAVVVLSYRSDGRPLLEDILKVFHSAGRRQHSAEELKFKYALSHKMDTKEALLVFK